MGSKKRDVELRDYFDAKLQDLGILLSERDQRYAQRFEDSERAVQSALSAAKEAVLKAEAANERRFESVNEFRQTLSDQTSTFMTRDYFDARHAEVERRLDTLEALRHETQGAERRSLQISNSTLSWLAVALAAVAILTGLAVRVLIP